MNRLEGRVALVTGAGRGIGRVYAAALAAEGARVVLADIISCEAAAAEIATHHGVDAALALAIDVADETSVKAGVDKALAWAGRIDVLVNNAALFAALENVAPTEIDVGLWDQVMAVNVRGSFLMVKHVAPGMIAHGYGKIVNIASGVAYKGIPEMLHYVTSKGAVLGLTRGLSRDLGRHGICVNSLAPGLTLSDSLLGNEEHLAANRERVVASRAIRRDERPEDLIGALIFLASAESDFMTGQSLLVDGGSVNL